MVGRAPAERLDEKPRPDRKLKALFSAGRASKRKEGGRATAVAGLIARGAGVQSHAPGIAQATSGIRV
jgi:hypothetical protein